MRVSITFDLNHRWLLIILLLLLAGLSIINVHGYSLPFWHYVLGDGTPGMDEVIWGTPRAIRGDDWSVILPMRLSQAYTTPPFALQNNLIGFDGINMAVAFPMPMAHFSTLFRPEVWGYFIGPNFGLSWNWWFIVLATFYSAFLLFMICSKNKFWLSAGVAICFLAAPFFSFWAFNLANVTVYLIIFLVSVYTYFLVAQGWKKYILIALIFWSGVAFVLTMYPAYQVTLGYFCLFFMAGFLLDRVSNLRDFRARCFTLWILAFFILAVVLAYVYDAYEAIELLMSTDYPGNRDSFGGLHGGGSLEPLRLFSNYALVLTDTQSHFPSTARELLRNQSEMSSGIFVFPLLLPAIVYTLWQQGRGQKIDFLQLFLVFYILFIGYWAMWGIPKPISTWLLLDNVPAPRIVAGLIVADLALLAIWLSTDRQMYALSLKARILASSIYGLFVFYCVCLLRTYLPEIDLIHAIGMGGVFFVIGFAVLSRLVISVLLIFLLSFGSVYGFNPVVLGGADDLQKHEFSKKIIELNGEVEGGATWVAYHGVAMGNVFRMFGMKALNGYLYYPPFGMWEILDPEKKYFATYNRTSNLEFILPDADKDEVIIDTQAESSVRVFLDPDHEAMRDIGVDYIVFTGEDPGSSRDFRCIAKVESFHQKHIYRVVHDSNIACP